MYFIIHETASQSQAWSCWRRGTTPVDHMIFVLHFRAASSQTLYVLFSIFRHIFHPRAPRYISSAHTSESLRIFSIVVLLHTQRTFLQCWVYFCWITCWVSCKLQSSWRQFLCPLSKTSSLNDCKSMLNDSSDSYWWKDEQRTREVSTLRDIHTFFFLSTSLIKMQTFTLTNVTFGCLRVTVSFRRREHSYQISRCLLRQSGRDKCLHTMQGRTNVMLTVCVWLCTWDGGVVAVLLAVAVLLSVCVLLRVLQAQLVTNLEGLADRPHDAHGLTLHGQRQKTVLILRTESITHLCCH